MSAVPRPAYFDQQQHTLTLPTVSSVTYVLRFLEKLCHNLHCDPLFGSQPVARGGLHYDSHTYMAGRLVPPSHVLFLRARLQMTDAFICLVR